MYEQIMSFLEDAATDSIYYTNYDEIDDIGNLYIDFDPANSSLCYKIIQCYNKYGFAVIDFGITEITSTTLELLAEILQLGAPYIPHYYSTKINSYDSTGFNTISLQLKNRQHRAFHTGQAQRLHVDGTLMPLGAIPTSMLGCQFPAFKGGETLIFNAVGAFTQLATNTPELAVAVLNQKSLTRNAIDVDTQAATGPVFGFKSQQLLSRFSIDETSNWNFRDVQNLEEAYHALVSWVQLPSPYYLEFTLRRNQCIVMANDLISHGRNAFEDRASPKRSMLRGLFQNKPQGK